MSKYKVKIKHKGKRIEVDSQHCKVGSIYNKPYKKPKKWQQKKKQRN